MHPKTLMMAMAIVVAPASAHEGMDPQGAMHLLMHQIDATTVLPTLLVGAAALVSLVLARRRRAAPPARKVGRR